jgi:hypothetical protein
MTHSSTAATSNPFATRFVRPAVGGYLFPGDERAEDLIDSLRDAGWWGQIVGPHGSGKSTLLHTLLPGLIRSGRSVLLHTLHQGQRRLPVGRSDAASWDSRTQIVVDGFEQLRWWSRIWLQRACHQRRAGLLVTVHQPLRLPMLWRTDCSPELACRIVARLVGPRDAAGINAAAIRECFAAHRGDMREVLMALYDVVEGAREE